MRPRNPRLTTTARKPKRTFPAPRPLLRSRGRRGPDRPPGHRRRTSADARGRRQARLAPAARPKSQAIRPTSDRLREALFNILMHSYGDPISGARVLDLFAGTGALGIEAVSRGAAYALFVDDGVEARALLRDNVETLGLGGVTRIFRRDATKLGPAYPVEPFSLAFLDPPYGKGLAELGTDLGARRQLAAAGRDDRRRGSSGCGLQDTRWLHPTRATRLRRHRVCFSIAFQITARCRRASTRHKSGGRDCTGRNSAPPPSRAAAHSFLPA